MTALARPDDIASLEARPELAPQPGSVGGIQAERRSFWADVEARGECWVWIGPVDKDGYGKFWTGQRYEVAHRFAYVSAVGRLHPELQVDHLCRVRACVRPDHLELVTPRENSLRALPYRPGFRGRGASERTHCCHGHPLSGDNLIITRQGSKRCRECKLASQRASRRRKPDPPRTEAQRARRAELDRARHQARRAAKSPALDLGPATKPIPVETRPALPCGRGSSDQASQ